VSFVVSVRLEPYLPLDTVQGEVFDDAALKALKLWTVLVHRSGHGRPMHAQISDYLGMGLPGSVDCRLGFGPQLGKSHFRTVSHQRSNRSVMDTRPVMNVSRTDLQ
jgi:hypothetical protein